MKLQEIFDQLSAGEFEQISIGGQARGVINEANYRQVLTHINLGLTQLFTRFHLKEGRVKVAHQPGLYTYHLSSAYAVAGRRAGTNTRYILDSTEVPFKDDILKVTKVLCEFGWEMGLNDAANPLSAMTPTLTTLVLPALAVDHDPSRTPYWLRGDKSTVVYRATHPLLAVGLGIFDPTRIEIELPYSHLQALLYFIASRVNNPIGMTNEFHAGNNYAAKFEQACRELEAENIQVDQGSQENRLLRNGWV